MAKSNGRDTLLRPQTGPIDREMSFFTSKRGTAVTANGEGSKHSGSLTYLPMHKLRVDRGSEGTYRLLKLSYGLKGAGGRDDVC